MKEKRDKSDTTPSKDPSSSVTLSPTLLDPANVLLIRAVDGRDTGLSAQVAEKKKKVEEKYKSVKSVKSLSSTSQLAVVSTDQRFEELDQKWSDRFNQLEALLLAKTLDQPQPELTFSTVKVAPAHPPPGNVVKQTNQQPLVFLVPSSRPEGILLVNQTLTLLYPTDPCGYICRGGQIVG